MVGNTKLPKKGNMYMSIVDNKMAISGSQQAVKVNGKVLTITKISLTGEKIAGNWEFLPHANVKVKCQKVEGSTKVSCDVEVKGKLVVSGTSAQGMFDVVSGLTGIKREKVDSLYKSSSPFRKDGKAGRISQLVDVTKLADVTL